MKIPIVILAFPLPKYTSERISFRHLGPGNRRSHNAQNKVKMIDHVTTHWADWLAFTTSTIATI